MTPFRGALVGAFVLAGLVLFGGGLFLIGDRRLLFDRQFELHSTFSKVTGLQVGTRVRLAGIDAGEVLEISLPARPSDSFRVRMRIREDLRPLIRKDSVAAVQTDGIVGNAFIQISVGTEAAPAVAPGDTIEGRDPIEFADLIQEGRETFRTVSREVVALKDDVSRTIDALTDTVTTANAVLTDVGGDVGRLTEASTRVVEDVRGSLGDVRGLVADVRGGRGTLGQLLTDRALYERMTAISREAELAVQNLRATTDRARAAVEQFTAPEGTAAQVAATLRNTLAEVQEVASDLAEGTEALKRNFLFRGFFRDRGFFDLDTISREAYLAGALEGEDRTAIRIWIDAARLFTRDDQGAERLTDAGRRRIDSAMADLIRYPRDSPLVIEGYAESRDGQAAYLISVDRAQAVRDYVVSRYRRQTTLTTIMPMSDVAPGSPRGDNRWSGVALAMFVDNAALAAGRR
ncbi:MAG TPA: MlaD family protein [Vicinamibacterales bacterium]|nr:MlaD family protein [Vicinamibacterales bacterium]